jgi:hypothetical protein
MRILLVAAVVFFLIAALSAFSTEVNVNEIGFIALGLAAFAGDFLAESSGASWSRVRARPLGRRGGLRRPL